jgi:hypothetical protein
MRYISEIRKAARSWAVYGSGIPAHTVWAHMMEVKDFHVAAPEDPQDIKDILRLLESVPEWKTRLHWLAPLSDAWMKLAPEWPALLEYPTHIAKIVPQKRKSWDDPMSMIKFAALRGFSTSDWSTELRSYDSLEEIEQRADKWVVGTDTGTSSRAVWGFMLGVGRSEATPSDPADLGRILRLLEIIPEWKPRVPHLAQLGEEWKALVDRWDELAGTMDDEVGIDWSKGDSASRTYDLMKEIHETARRKN